MNKKMFVELSKIVDERVEMMIEKFNTAIEEYKPLAYSSFFFPVEVNPYFPLLFFL